MGWDGVHDRTKYAALKPVGKSWTCESGTKVTIRKHHAHGAEDWYIFDILKPDGTTEAIITMDLWDGGMVKHMDEASGPYFYGCPIEWLDEVPEPPHAYNWRKAMRARHAATMVA